MEVGCLAYWRTVVDHLMTHDKTTFGDFLSKMSAPQSGTGLNKLFSSKDQENDLRAQLTKRLAFILFCSEKDQYSKYMSEIQGWSLPVAGRHPGTVLSFQRIRSLASDSPTFSFQKK